MSWNISTKGTTTDVRHELDRQFGYLLGCEPHVLKDKGERETVHHVRQTLAHILGTFGPEKTVSVSANGHSTFVQYEPIQTVNISIQSGKLIT